MFIEVNGEVFGTMAKSSFLRNAVFAVLYMSVILWQETLSSTLGPYWTTVTQETTAGGGCAGVDCPYYGRCEPDAHNQPICVCPVLCPMIYRPVCGSDNTTYDNECMLQVKACNTSTNITVLHNGTCDEGFACGGEPCPPGKCCQPDSKGRPGCVCSTACPFIYAPVCGSDGQTYVNDCLLRVEACKTNTTITMVHEGNCNNSCTGFQCPYYGHCEPDADNQPMCVCRLGCPRNYRPVCGSDNETYPNDCVLESEACVNQTNITILHEGECCGEGSKCFNITCPPGKRCRQKQKDLPECVCNEICTEIYAPVCGSDNKTYGNECELKREACITNTSITVLRNGTCNGGVTCYGVTCPDGKSCELDSEGRPRCVCNTMGPMHIDPVCGSDERTYNNSCLLEVAACETNTNITIVHKGSCNDTTPTGPTIPSTPPDHWTKKP